MKDLQYITHDLGARNDPKLLNLQMRMGGQGLAIYWCLVEMLWENDGYLPTDYEAIAFALRWASEAEVQRVVTEFGLFEQAANRFWSRSALERIEQKRERLSSRETSARNAARARWQREGDAPAMRTQCDGKADAMPINIDIQKEREKERNSNNNTPAPLTAAAVTQIFLFELNFKDPEGEAKRFLDFYNAKGWTYADGTPVKDAEAAARGWKPQKAGKRFDAEALNWYRAVWNAARTRITNAHEVFVEGLETIRRKENQIALVFRTKAAGQTAATFIQDNDLAGDYAIDYRLAT